MFLGRENELKQLIDLKSDRYSRFVAIKGRRRIGKSQLIEEFSKGFSKKYLLPSLFQLQELQKSLKEKSLFNKWLDKDSLTSKAMIGVKFSLNCLKKPKKGWCLLRLMRLHGWDLKILGFLGKLKIAWDQFFQKNPNLILVIASSVSSWIDKNILNSTAFFGRVDLTLSLEELPIKECVKFWKDRQRAVSSYEKLKMLAVTGGVPKYLEMINPKISAEENIRKLCFLKSGFLFNDFERIFQVAP